MGYMRLARITSNDVRHQHWPKQGKCWMDKQPLPRPDFHTSHGWLGSCKESPKDGAQCRGTLKGPQRIYSSSSPTRSKPIKKDLDS